MAPTLLSIKHLTVRYLNNVLLEDLTFNLNKGDNWAIIGKSGSGKSALLQTIAGRFNITGGQIEYNFYEDFLPGVQNQDDIITHHKLVAIVESKHHFKNLSNTSAFYYQQRYNSSGSEDALTVEQYLHQIKTVKGRTVYWTFEKVIQTLNLHNLQTKELIKLSNGETRRLMLAAALLKNPVILLLDNPLTGLDVETRTSFNTLMNEIVASGITVMMATSAREIPDSITHIAVLQNGKIKYEVAKADYDPETFAKENISSVDKQKLSALLTATKSNNGAIVGLGCG